MKLDVHEAAKLLNTSERTIYRWIREGSIPCRRINDHYRFHRAELLEWATARGMVTAVDAFPPSRPMSEVPLPMFAAALEAGGVHHHVEGTERESVLRAIVKRMPLEDEADRELLLDVMLAREALGSTGIGDGIAIPHVRSPIVLHTTEPSITLCFLDHPIDFQAIDWDHSPNRSSAAGAQLVDIVEIMSHLESHGQACFLRHGPAPRRKA